MNDCSDFLFEIGAEELPPKALQGLSQSLGIEIKAGLEKAGLGHEAVKLFATPRRLAVLVENLATSQADTVNEKRGPALTAAFDTDGNPTPAAQGFARSCGIAVDQLETLENDKGAWLVFRQSQQGRRSRDLLPDIVTEALARLPIPKRMRWGSLSVEFVRPVHWLVMLLGDEVVDAEIFGIKTGRETRGHRFHHPESIYIAEPAAYAPLLESEGRVIADFETRREAIRAQALEQAANIKAQAVIDEALLDEVTGMVEWPVALLGTFEPRFLDVPAEALISAMKGHQKYFHIVDGDGNLKPCFITISNIESLDMSIVRSGNERVIRPRLADADFFWNQDRKHKLSTLVDKQKSVVFQKKLGTLHDKTRRVARQAVCIAEQLGSNQKWAERAASLSKCDLMTDMVGEFPELQGIMGRYYALHDKEPEEVALALDEQYMPRHAGDALPVTATGQCLAIADKLDTLTGIFGIGQIPSGDKDPFGLRRAALGVLRIIIEQKLPLDLIKMLGDALNSYQQEGNKDFSEDVVEQVYVFMMERLRAYYLDAGVGYDVFDAVLSRRPTRPYDLDLRIHAVQIFRNMLEAESLTAANKRISNILKQAQDTIPEQVNSSLFQEDAERTLAEQMTTLSDEVIPLFDKGDYEQALTRLAALRTPVDNFFDTVMVMTDDTPLRMNRLALLTSMHHLFMRAADLSCLQAPSRP